VVITITGTTLVGAINSANAATDTNVQVDGITGVSSVILHDTTTGGVGYAVGNVLSALNADIGGTSTSAGSFVLGKTYTILTVGTTNFALIGATTVVSSSLVVGNRYIIDTLGTSNFALAGATTVTAGSFVIGNSYVIETLGTTNFTLIGAASNTVGTSFIATGVGSGTGTAYNSSFIASATTAGTGTAYNPSFIATGAGSGTGSAGSLFSVKVASVNAGSNLVDTWYSTNPRSNVPYRVVGYLDVAETVAGTWTALPALVQGVGGNDMIKNLVGGVQNIEIITSGQNSGVVTRSYVGPVLIEYVVNVVFTGGNNALYWYFYLNGNVVWALTNVVNYQVMGNPTFRVLYYANGPFTTQTYLVDDTGQYLNQICLTYL
jgi:hypothetical protein